MKSGRWSLEIFPQKAQRKSDDELTSQRKLHCLLCHSVLLNSQNSRKSDEAKVFIIFIHFIDQQRNTINGYSMTIKNMLECIFN